MTQPAQRVRITHPRTEAARRGAHRPVSREIDEQTRIGELYMSSLIRAQRRLGVLVCLTVGLVLGGTALLGAAAPGFAAERVMGVPLPWVVLGVAVYPVLIGLAALTVRQAERNEHDFTHLVRRR